ncbi:MAG TPA: TolC family protein [Bacteroidota bacterium]|nr:TolC family protein [Bacteroidota bacterium]
MRKTFFLTLTVYLSLLSRAPGQTSAYPVNPDSSLQIILDTLPGSHLPLKEAVSAALNGAVAVQSAKAVYMSARGVSRRESGAFDPQLFFTFNRLVQDQPQGSFFSGASALTTQQNTTTGGVSMNLPIGTNITASLSGMSLETNSTFANLNPQYTTFAGISFRQPLLSGFFVSGYKNKEKADRDEDAAKARYDQEVLAVSTQVEQSYWDLYAAERDYAVQNLVRDRAIAFLKDTETRAVSGLVGPDQVANARTFLAEQEIALLDREEQLDRSSDDLAALIGVRPDSGRSRFIAADNPPSDIPVEDLQSLLDRAKENNLTLRAAKADVDAQHTLLRASSWEALPKIDLVGSIGGNGLSGTAHDVYFNGDTLTTTWGGVPSDAVRQALHRDYPTWSIGVEVTIPLLLRSGLGEKDRIEAETILAEQREIGLSRALEEEVRAGYRDVSNGKRRLVAARQGVDAAQEQVRIGLIEFQNGRTTAFELVRLGADFATAQQRYTQALVRSAKAAAGLRQLTSGAYPSSR